MDNFLIYEWRYKKFKLITITHENVSVNKLNELKKLGGHFFLTYLINAATILALVLGY